MLPVKAAATFEPRSEDSAAGSPDLFLHCKMFPISHYPKGANKIFNYEQEQHFNLIMGMYIASYDKSLLL